jgi:hypothetical protein
LTIKNGRAVYDLNGITRDDWDKLPPNYGLQRDAQRGASPRALPSKKKQ